MRTKIAYSVALWICLIATGLWTPGCHMHPRKRTINFETANPPPSNWTPSRSSRGALLFRRKDLPMGIMVSTECERYQSVPLTPLSRTLFIGFENRKELSRGSAKVDGHEAVEVTMECSLEGVPLKVETYTFKAEGCIYDIAYFASPEHFDEGLKDFEEFVRVFKIGKK